MERTGIEPVTSDLQIPGSAARLGQIRSVNAKLRWLGEVEIGYSGTRFGTRHRWTEQLEPDDRYCASVTLESPRGRSGSKPLPRASAAAKSCPGTTERSGERSGMSGSGTGSRYAAPSMALRSEEHTSE